MGAHFVNLTSCTDLYLVVYIRKGSGHELKQPQKAREQCKRVEESAVRQQGVKGTLAQGRKHALSGAAAARP